MHDVGVGRIRIDRPAIEGHISIDDRSSVNEPNRISRGNVDGLTTKQSIAIATNCVDRERAIAH